MPYTLPTPMRQLRTVVASPAAASLAPWSSSGQRRHHQYPQRARCMWRAQGWYAGNGKFRAAQQLRTTNDRDYSASETFCISANRRVHVQGVSVVSGCDFPYEVHVLGLLSSSRAYFLKAHRHVPVEIASIAAGADGARQRDRPLGRHFSSLVAIVWGSKHLRTNCCKRAVITASAALWSATFLATPTEQTARGPLSAVQHPRAGTGIISTSSRAYRSATGWTTYPPAPLALTHDPNVTLTALPLSLSHALSLRYPQINEKMIRPSDSHLYGPAEAIRRDS